MRRLTIVCAVLASLGLAGCGDEGGNAQANAVAGEKAASVDAIGEAEGLSMAGRLIKTAGLDRLLTGPGSYTVFAPSDEAFEALAEDQRTLLESEEGRPQLVALLRQHMTSGYVTPNDFGAAVARSGPQVEVASLGAGPIIVRKQGEAILLGQGDGAARIIGQSVSVGNSIVYKIDRILPPPAGG